MRNTINWYEIPVTDFARAKKFYEHVLGGAIHEQDMMGMTMGFLPMESPEGVGGAIVKGEGYVPTMTGALVYLNADPDVSTYLKRVVEAGGKVLLDKTLITDDIGYMGIFADSEGNRVAFHSPKR